MGAKLLAAGPGTARLEEIRRSLRGLRVRVGVLGDGQIKPGRNGSSGATLSRGPEALTNAELAAIHEFGAPRANVPERSFLRATADTKRQEWLALMERAVRLALAGKLTPEDAMGFVGQQAVADIVSRIRRGAGIPPPLQPATIRAKGSTRPLVDTGRLVQSISYAVRRG